MFDSDHRYVTPMPTEGPTPTDIAHTILDGFNRHYALFRYSAQRAKVLFESASWHAIQKLSRERIEYYDIRVRECAVVVRTALRGSRAVPDQDEHTPSHLDAQQRAFWLSVKTAYVALLRRHHQPECAETFFNSVSCRVLHRTYFNNDFLFVRPAVATEYLSSNPSAYRAYYPLEHGLEHSLYRIIVDYGLAAPFANLPADIRLLARRILQRLRERLPNEAGPRLGPDCQIHTLHSLFFRNKGAYIVGRFINHGHTYAFAIALTHTPAQEIEIDALLDSSDDISTLFSFTRAYFLVDMEAPSAYVSFLVSLLPRKSKAEFYTAIGLQKQGKTLFYRDFLHHLEHSTDQFVLSPGIEGMVMVVFTLPSYPYVFKVIRDRIRKADMTHAIVKERYQRVKKHDRAGRMADTWEYSQVALPRKRFSPELLTELRREIPHLLEESAEQIVIRHVYIERRMLPLNMYLNQANDHDLRAAIKQYGDAIRELAANNIFPGDMLYKNFGMTRLGRLVFYDYDEIQNMTEMNFRVIPPAPNEEAEMANEPWYPIGKNDVFPEEFAWFLLGDPRIRDAFMTHHADLLRAEWWQQCRDRVARGKLENIYPYDLRNRLAHPHRSAST